MKKKIVILGTSGMLGSTLFNFLKTKSDKIKVFGVERDNKSKSKLKDIFKFKELYSEKFINFLKHLNPEILINCVGVINHRIKKNNLLDSFFINSIFPHLLSEVCKNFNCKMIHISTDCVFSGKKGNYKESDIADETNVYGLSKRIGEPFNSSTIVIRSSIIGHEKFNKLGLLEWFLHSKNSVKGFANVYFSGLTTLELSNILYDYFINKDILKTGLVHIAGPKISKFDLLNLINTIYSKNIKIIPEKSKKIDKSLDSSYFKSKSNYKIKKWQLQIEEMKQFHEKFF
jgi:dTDP-4-dehydrorhamnose reductase